MDSSQFPSMQPMNGVEPNQPITSAAPGMAPNGMPMVQQVNVLPEPKKDIVGLIKTIAIIVVSLIAVTFIGLFIWMSGEKSELQSEWDTELADEKAKALDEPYDKLEKEFRETEKYPYDTFAGPVDYGSLSFEYPKTWSVYVAAAATAGGDFNAYFNPIQVDAVSKETINALRVTIRNTGFDDVSAEYDKAMNKKDVNLTLESTRIGKNGNITANRYTGTIPDTELSGIIVTFKIRDKTAILQTDSEIFRDDFDKLLTTVEFNE